MIGETLRKTREASGLELKEISESLKIRLEYLKAIENNDFKKMPADVFTIGYIRDYARFLNISADQLIEAYLEAQKPEDLPPEPTLVPPPVKKGTGPSRIYLAAGLIIPALLAAGFLVYSKLLSPLLKKDSTATALSSSQTINVTKPLPSSPANQAVPAPPPAHAENTYTLRATASEAVWLRIETQDGRNEDMLIKPGESREWSSHKGFSLWLGNAGGIRLVLNGKDLGPLGLSGQTLRLKLPAQAVPDKE